MDLFLVHAYLDQEYASGLEDTLSGRGLVVGEPLSLWPGQRLLPPIDQRLHESRSAIVIVSQEFLKFSYSRKELDGLTTRRQGHRHPLGRGRGGRVEAFPPPRRRGILGFALRPAGSPPASRR